MEELEEKLKKIGELTSEILNDFQLDSETKNVVSEIQRKVIEEIFKLNH